MRSPLFVKALGLAAFVFLGCDAGNVADPPATGGPLETIEMPLVFHMQDTMTACGEALGIRVAISNGLETKTCEANWALPLVSDPYTSPNDFGDHHVADCLFVVAPGDWKVTSVEVIGIQGAPLECCTEAYPPIVNVQEGQTTEFGAELSCDLIGSGAIDVYGWLNRPPVVKALTIYPSKFTTPCLPLFISASAEDREGDFIRFDWEVVSAPRPFGYAIWGHRGWASFIGTVPGTYQIRVTVTDEHGLYTDLTFPVHVVVSPVFLPTDASAAAEQSCCEEEPKPPEDFEVPAE